MNIRVEVLEGGALKLKSPSLTPGTELEFSTNMDKTEIVYKTNWDALEMAIDEARKIDSS